MFAGYKISCFFPIVVSLKNRKVNIFVRNESSARFIQGAS
ncbi:hypothetical protein HMPREF0971_03106 [Segatella oris F0302]|uniref:Uncharacterized protein n=1 Tax=Segatella oris F0302 TaxID=649760 RepID=D1QVR6_9BACT|nr:hypothetical protein HMPREF0971_03106 [Segatella oris F0302]